MLLSKIDAMYHGAASASMQTEAGKQRAAKSEVELFSEKEGEALSKMATTMDELATKVIVPMEPLIQRLNKKRWRRSSAYPGLAR
jgi:hypothetical protein